MLHNRKARLFIVATLCAAGCAKSDFQVARQSRTTLRPAAADRAMANAPEEKPPKILPETHFAAGMLFERQGQSDPAIAQYRKAVALNHNYVAAYHRLALLLSAAGQHLEAAETLQRAVAQRPENAVLRNDLGFEWMLAQQWDDAERELRKAVELQPDLATAHINLGMVLAKSGRFGESLSAFQTVLPEADAYYNLGLMFRGQQMYPEAANAFRQVLTINPQFTAAKTQLDQITQRTEPKTPALAMAETPQPKPIRLAFPKAEPQAPAAAVEIPRQTDLLALLEAVTAPGDARSPTTPEVAEEEAAAEPEHRWGTTLTDLAALLAIIDGNAGRNSDLDIEIPVAAEEFVEETEHDSSAVAATPGPADLPFEEQTAWPADPLASEETAEVVEEEPFFGPTAAPEPVLAVGDANDQLAPCDPESDQADADEVIAALSVEPMTAPTALGDSWAMVEELEAKVAMLRSEISAPRPGNGDVAELALLRDAFAASPTPLEEGPPSLDADDDSAVAGDDKADDLDERFLEFDDEDAAGTNGPRSSIDAAEEAPYNEAAPSDAMAIWLWTAEFGELTALLSIVRNETLCWNELDAQDRDLLAFGETRGPCLETAEQTVLLGTEEPSPAASGESEDPASVTVDEPVPTWPMDPSGDVLATQPRTLDPLPD
ncbi:MAG: tetratricopeptide repeat protein [Planctomycetota bacterium]